MLFEQKFSYIYSAYFSFEFLSKFGFFWKNANLKERFKKKIQKNEIQKKKMNFERTLFDQTTSSHIERKYKLLQKYRNTSTRTQTETHKKTQTETQKETQKHKTTNTNRNEKSKKTTEMQLSLWDLFLY